MIFENERRAIGQLTSKHIAIGRSLGLTEESCRLVTRLCYGTVRRTLQWDWAAAGVKSNTLSVVDMFETLVYDSYAALAADPNLTEPDAVALVRKPWAAEMYKMADVVHVERKAVPRTDLAMTDLHKQEDLLYHDGEIQRIDDADEARSKLRPILARMTKRQREVMLLVSEGYKYREVSDVLGISEAMVQKAVSQTRRLVSEGGLTSLQ